MPPLLAHFDGLIEFFWLGRSPRRSLTLLALLILSVVLPGVWGSRQIPGEEIRTIRVALLQVNLDPVADVGALHLDHDLLAVLKLGSMHLSDRGGGE